jgi:hypothetical protein
MSRRCLLPILLALALAPAAAATAAPEHLVTAPYPGGPWKVTVDQAANGGFYHEQIPVGQTLDTIKDILTSQSIPAARGKSPSDVLRSIFSGVVPACDDVKVNGPVQATEGGFPVAYGQVYCSHQKGKPYGVNIFYKIIGGAEAIYAIDRDFNVPPSAVAGVEDFPKGQEAQAMALMRAQSVANSYLVKSVYLCGGASTDPRCKGH